MNAHQKKAGHYLGTLLLFLALFASQQLQGQTPTGWQPLGSRYSTDSLSSLLLSRDNWNPYPRYGDSESFSQVPDYARQAILREAERYRDAVWVSLPATTFLEFARVGNRTDYEILSFRRRRQLAVLVLAEAFERKGRFLDAIINGIWATCEESFWGVPAHLSFQKAGIGLPDVQDPIVDLFAAETAQQMAWTYYLLKPALDSVNPLIAKRIAYEEKRRILEPYLAHNDWGYQGFIWRKDPTHHGRVNNWNPWINANVLVTAALTAEDPALRARVIHKTLESFDNFMIPYPSDGGSDEGPEYWELAAGSVIDYLETLKSVTAGRIDVMSRPILYKMGSYIYKTHISGSYFFNYGDADALSYPDPLLLFRFGRDTRDSLLMQFAASQALQQHVVDNPLYEPFGVLNRGLASLTLLNTLSKVTPKAPLLRDAWFPDLEIMAARSREGSREGLYLGVKGGNNGESHNHNDVGNFVVYVDGAPALIDAGAQTYTRETFNKSRYEIWNNQSSYHNLPDINGYGERSGGEYKARGIEYSKHANTATLAMDISGAYPKQAAVVRWIRTVSLIRVGHITVSDHYQLKKFLVPAVENFLTPLACDISQKGVVTFEKVHGDGVLQLHYDPRQFTAAIDTIRIDDGRPRNTPAIRNNRTGRMYTNWGDHLYRLRLTALTRALTGKFTFTIEKP